MGLSIWLLPGVLSLPSSPPEVCAVVSNHGSCDLVWASHAFTCSYLTSVDWDCSGCNCPGDRLQQHAAPPQPAASSSERRSRQPVHQQHARQPAQDAAGGTPRRGGGPPAAHNRLAAEHAVRVFVYPAPVAPFLHPYAWRFEPLIADLTAMGFVTRNMSEADVFLIVNHLERSTDMVAELINNLRSINPKFTWRNHFLMLPCDHGPGDSMFNQSALSENMPASKVTPATRAVHPNSGADRQLRYMMVSGDQHSARFRPGHDLRLPVHMKEPMPQPVLRLEVPPPRRELLFFWGGASRKGGPRDIRRKLWKHQANTTGFYVPISTFGNQIPPNSRTSSVRFDHWMPRSVFCGSPPGWDGGDSNRYLPALVHGCIPVFLLEGEAMPFEETVDWTSSAVRVRRENIKTLDRILRAIPPWRVKQMQRALPRTLARLTYQAQSPHGWPKELRTKGAARSFVHFVCAESPWCITTNVSIEHVTQLGLEQHVTGARLPPSLRGRARVT